MNVERAERLTRLAKALEARRRLAALQRAAIDDEIAEIGRREAETLEFSAVVAGERAVASALVRRLADLDARRHALRRESAALADKARRDRRLARGAERVADRLDAAAARAEELRSLELWLDAAFAGRAARRDPAAG